MCFDKSFCQCKEPLSPTVINKQTSDPREQGSPAVCRGRPRDVAGSSGNNAAFEKDTQAPLLQELSIQGSSDWSCGRLVSHGRSLRLNLRWQGGRQWVSAVTAPPFIFRNQALLLRPIRWDVGYGRPDEHSGTLWHRTRACRSAWFPCKASVCSSR